MKLNRSTESEQFCWSRWRERIVPGWAGEGGLHSLANHSLPTDGELCHFLSLFKFATFWQRYTGFRPSFLLKTVEVVS